MRRRTSGSGWMYAVMKAVMDEMTEEEIAHDWEGQRNQ
jgi:hypothetical protein